jgi:HAD superfamily hydrolase (TIGR01509 family)
MKIIKNTIKAVIFDMDGTIIKTEHLWDEATRKVLIRRGVASFTGNQEEILRSLSGIGLVRSAEVIKEKFNLEDRVTLIADETKAIAHELFNANLEFIDGFEDFHKKLRKHSIRTGVATNACKSSLQMIGQKMNLKQFFGENLYCIETVGNRGKPDPAIFLHVAKVLNVKPHECVVFEDSLFGFQAAKAAGMKCIAIKNKINLNKINLANSAIDSYDEAEEAIKSIL